MNALPPKKYFKTCRLGDEGRKISGDYNKANLSQPWGCHDAKWSLNCIRKRQSISRDSELLLLYVVLTNRDSCSLGAWVTVWQEKTKVGAYLVVLTLYDSEFGARIPLGKPHFLYKACMSHKHRNKQYPKSRCYLCKLQILSLILRAWYWLDRLGVSAKRRWLGRHELPWLTRVQLN